MIGHCNVALSFSRVFYLRNGRSSDPDSDPDTRSQPGPGTRDAAAGEAKLDLAGKSL
jgi:hypothetical protein